MKSFLTYLGGLLLLIVTSQGFAANIVEVIPLNRHRIMVHIDDGYVRHHQLGERRDEEWVIATPINTANADLPGSYLISSPDDAAYQVAVVPQGLNRKTKPTDFTWLCQTWNNGCFNTDPDHADEHWIYLHVPSDLQNGKTYQVSFPGLAGLDPVSFVYDDLVHRSEAVHVNQLGYVPQSSEKFGYVYHWLGDGGGLDLSTYANNSFHLIHASTGASAYSGTLAFRKGATNQEFAYPFQAPPYGNLVGVEVYECDFSTFQTPGEYRLCVTGIGCSFPFEISDEVYEEPMQAVLNGLYQQRSGLATLSAYTDQPRPPAHHPALTPGFAGKLQYSTFRYPDFSDSDKSESDKPAIEAGILGPLDSWGWYQDAGDWDSYYRHSDVSNMLLWLYEMGGKRFGDNQLALPEAGNGTPDLLDEAMWLPRFYHRLRQELISKNYGTGGVGGGRVFGDLWGGDENSDGSTKGSWQDSSRIWVCTGEDPFMTYKYAGLAAHIAFLQARDTLTDPDGVDWETEAIEAYQWASQHTLPQDVDQFGLKLLDIRLYAAANLYRLTGDNSYQQALLQDWATNPTAGGISSELLFGMATYVLTDGIQQTNTPILSAMKNAIEAESNFILFGFRDDRACRWGGNYYLPFLIGQSTTPLVQAGIMGHYLFRNDPIKSANYLGAIYSTADYFLGNNPLNMVWITGVGERSPAEIFNLDSWYIGGDSPRKGIVPYGPWEGANDYGPLGPWNHLWPYNFTHPSNKDLWPGHERWFDQRTSPLAAEYTVDQNLGPAIFTYGYLFAQTAQDFPLAISPEQSSSLAIKVYPNPSKGAVTIELPGEIRPTSILVYGMDGRLLVEQAWQSGELSLHQLTPGIYFIGIRDESGTYGFQKLRLEGE